MRKFETRLRRHPAYSQGTLTDSRGRHEVQLLNTGDMFVMVFGQTLWWGRDVFSLEKSTSARFPDANGLTDEDGRLLFDSLTYEIVMYGSLYGQDEKFIVSINYSRRPLAYNEMNFHSKEYEFAIRLKTGESFSISGDAELGDHSYLRQLEKLTSGRIGLKCCGTCIYAIEDPFGASLHCAHSHRWRLRQLRDEEAFFKGIYNNLEDERTSLFTIQEIDCCNSYASIAQATETTPDEAEQP